MTAKKIHPAAHQYLQENGLNVLFLTDDHADEIDQIVSSQSVDAIIARTHAIGRQTIKKAKNLQIISRHGVGYDNIDVDAASAGGIPVTIAPGTNAQAVAEMTLALMFAVVRRIVPMANNVRQGGWDRAVSGIELSGKTIGIVGYGRIGQRVAEMCSAIGMNVCVFDPFSNPDAGVNSSVNSNTNNRVNSSEPASEPASVAVSEPANVAVSVGASEKSVKKRRFVDRIEALVSESDVVSLHCPAQPDGSPLINAQLLTSFRKGAVLINTSRGSLIDEDALARSIQAGIVAGAGLDTLCSEPPEKDNPLLQLDQVVVTPHMGGSTAQALEKTAMRAAMNVVDFLRNGKVEEDFLINKRYAGE